MIPGTIAALLGGAVGALAIADLGANTNSAGATLTLTPVTVPAGSLIVICVTEKTTTSTIGSLSDGANTYTQAGTTLSPNASALNGVSAIFFSANSTALSSGTITYTKNTSGKGSGISAFYWTGAAASTPLDGAVTASATGSSTNPTVTSGAPAQTGELLVALLGFNPITYTQAPGWNNPPDGTGTGILINGGNQTGGAAAATFNPTLSVSNAWSALVVGFKHS